MGGFWLLEEPEPELLLPVGMLPTFSLWALFYVVCCYDAYRHITLEVDSDYLTRDLSARLC
jgi:hypothetical protein